MAQFNKFNQFVADVANKVHNLGADSLKVLLSNVLPVAGNSVKADITEIAAGFGYAAGGAAVNVASSAQVAGLYKLVPGADPIFQAAGGDMATFRYVVLYNDTPAVPLDPLIGWYDYGAAVTLHDGETFVPDFDAINGILQLQSPA